MIGSLFNLLGGWKQVRSGGGFSYRVSRSGKRCIIPVEGYRNPGLADQQWLETGVFADDGLSDRFRDFSYAPPKQSRQNLRGKAPLEFAR